MNLFRTARRRPLHSRAGAAVVAGVGSLCLLGGGPAARADLKVVSSVTTNASNLPSPAHGPAGNGPQTQTVTAYYKGDKIRTETTGQVILLDAAGDKVVTLDGARKTYTVNATQKTLEQAKPFLSMLKISVNGDVTPGGAMRTIAGLSAQNYRIGLRMSMGLDAAALGAMSAQGGGAAPIPSGPLLTMKMEGEQWTTNALPLSAARQNYVVNSALRSLGGALPGVEQMAQKMAVIRGFPLASKITITMTPAPGMAGMMGGSGARGPIVLTTTTTATAVSQDPLPDALFTVPADYKQVEPDVPAFPAMPGGGGTTSGGGGATSSR